MCLSHYKIKMSPHYIIPVIDVCVKEKHSPWHHTIMLNECKFKHSSDAEKVKEEPTYT